MKKINLEDILIEIYCSGVLAGPDTINYDDKPLIQITHIPSGILVECSEGSSIYESKDLALKKLRLKLEKEEK